MDPAAALADLTEISSQIESAVVVAEDGSTLAATGLDDDRAQRLGRVGLDLLEGAEGLGGGSGRKPAHVEARLAEGSVFAVREAAHVLAATTVPEPTAGLVLYDLRACLRSLGDVQPRKRGARKRETA